MLVKQKKYLTHILLYDGSFAHCTNLLVKCRPVFLGGRPTLAGYGKSKLMRRKKFQDTQTYTRVHEVVGEVVQVRIIDLFFSLHI